MRFFLFMWTENLRSSIFAVYVAKIYKVFKWVRKHFPALFAHFRCISIFSTTNTGKLTNQSTATCNIRFSYPPLPMILFINQTIPSKLKPSGQADRKLQIRKFQKPTNHMDTCNFVCGFHSQVHYI